MRNLHPAISFSYFTFVIMVTVLFLHPVTLAISLVSALLYAVYLNGLKSLRLTLLFLLPMVLLAALVNPLFNQLGNTILFRIGDLQITLESTLYGLATATMLAAMILWFSCYNKLMTSDKLMFIFGRILPAASLIFSMTLRFIPRYTAQVKKTLHAQRAIHGIHVFEDQGRRKKPLIERIRSGLAIFSIMVTWALENGVDTADSMRSRGYGLKGRTTYSIYRMDSRDMLLAGLGLYFIVMIIAAILLRVLSISYFPWMLLNPLGIPALLIYLAFLLLCLFPLLLDGFEALKWHFSRSRI